MRIRVAVVVVAGLAVASGCDGSATPATSVSPSSTGRPSASGTGGEPGPGLVSLEILGDEPVLTGADVNDDWVLPGALTFAGGTYHLWGMAFDQETRETHGYYATSTDGASWTVDEVDPLAGLGLDLTYPGGLPGSVLLETDGTWTMYLWGVPAPRQRESALFRATAQAPEGPWTAAPDPVLTGTESAWDQTYLDFPSVVTTADGYLMLYGGGSAATPERSAVGLATSNDGVSWTKVPEPVIEPGLCGAFDERSVAIPRFRMVDSGYLAFYNGLGEDRDRPADVGAAFSVDGRTWICVSPSPALTAEDIPGSDGIHTIAVAAAATGPEFIVESLEGNSSTLWLGDVDMSQQP